MDKKVPVSSVVFRDDLYPRIETSQAKVNEYIDSLDVLPPIEVNQHNEIIDGWHRWTAHKKAKAEEIAVTVTETKSDNELFTLACRRNARHGLQLSAKDKKKAALRMYAEGTGEDKARIAKDLSVTERTVSGWLTDIDKRLREERDETIRAMWLACHTQQQIADEVGVTKETISQTVQECQKLESFPKSDKLHALYQEPEWEPPLYDIWNQSKQSNKAPVFGSVPSEFVDNLLYTFTEPFDIVVDPFAGSGSTIDLCKRRLRRYWVSDRAPDEARTDIRQFELSGDGISGPSRWADVALVYLDPPYWKQAEGKYSQDDADLANMSLEEFTDTLIAIICAYGKKLPAGAHIACITSPTQWPNDDKSTNYHDIDLACRVNNKLQLVRRVVCPYSTQQYNGTQVEIAKERKLWMVLSRTMLIWQVAAKAE